MLRLRTLGGLALSGPATPTGAAAQKSRVAVLAALAAAGERGMTRDRLFALFWPDSDAERARNALNQAVFVLRRDVADDVFIGTAADLRLNAAVIRSDVADFDCAVRHEDWETAAGLYAGPFLDGVYLREAQDFERWTAEERSRLLRSYELALTRLAAAADAHHDAAGSVRWRKLLTVADPLSARAAFGYMSALVAAGDRTAALDFARAHEALLRKELDVAPDHEITELVRTLRVRDGQARLQKASENGDQGYAAFLRDALSDRYEIEQPLDRSPLWSAFRARTKDRDDPILLRVLHGTVAQTIVTERFVAELCRARGAHGAGIIPLHDAASRNGIVYFTSGLAPGSSLRDRLRRQHRLSVAESVGIATDVANALSAAHAAGVLHLNVKPRNIFVHDGHAYLADAGIAAALDAAVAGEASQSGLISLGTPAYISPEQARGMATLDERTDIYALGCVLYQLLTGEPPFAGSSPATMVTRRLVEAPPLIEADWVPPTLKDVLASALARDPADRFGSARDLGTALAMVLRGASDRQSPVHADS